MIISGSFKLKFLSIFFFFIYLFIFYLFIFLHKKPSQPNIEFYTSFPNWKKKSPELKLNTKIAATWTRFKQYQAWNYKQARDALPPMPLLLAFVPFNSFPIWCKKDEIPDLQDPGIFTDTTLENYLTSWVYILFLETENKTKITRFNDIFNEWIVKTLKIIMMFNPTMISQKLARS